MQLLANNAWTFAHTKLAYKRQLLPSGSLHLRLQAIGVGRRASVRRSRVLTVTTRAFKTQTDAPTYKDAFPEPMEYAALLGLQGREGNLQDSQIISAYEELAASPLEKGYSKSVEEGRLGLLHAAVDGVRRIRSMALRSDRQSLALMETRCAMVQWWLLPAALSLLQETGQAELVLEYGSIALGRREASQHKRDILLSMALAHCSLSSEAFAGKDKIGLGCAHLEEALTLLEEAGFSPGMSKLASEIQEGLRELKPHCVLEHLKLPLDAERKQTRRQAIGVLKSLLANPELAVKSDGSNGVDRTFLRKSLGLLTSAETVSLLDWQDIARNETTIPWYFDGLVERGAMAHILTGFVQRRPALIEEGSMLLQSRGSADLLIERVVACVLLADTQTASHLLLEAESRGYFRREATLADALQSGDGTASSSGLGSIVADSDSQELPPKGETLGFIRGNSPDGDYDLLPGLCLFTERWLSQVAFPRFKDTAAGQASSSLTEYYESERVTSFISVKTKDNDTVRAGLLVLSDRLSHLLQRLRDSPLSTRNARSHKRTELPKLALPEGAAGARRRASPAKMILRPPLPPLPRGTQILTVLLLGATAYLAATTARRIEDDPLPRNVARIAHVEPQQQQQQSGPTKLWRWRAPWQSDSRVHALRPRAAEACIRRWQVAKAAAMGPRHDDSLLTQVVTEPYLSTVRKDASSARKAGWFWSYRLSDLYVENVDNSELQEDSGGEAVVTARLREKGELFAVTGKRADAHCYDNSYRAEYRMARQPDGSWRISSVLVLGEGDD